MIAKAEEIRRKYRGEFTHYDFIYNNKFRLLILNLSEWLALRGFEVSKSLTIFGRNIMRGLLPGYLTNNLVYLSTYSVAAQSSKDSKLQPLKFGSIYMLMSVLTYPL